MQKNVTLDQNKEISVRNPFGRRFLCFGLQFYAIIAIVTGDSWFSSMRGGDARDALQ